MRGGELWYTLTIIRRGPHGNERKWMVTNWPDEKSFPLTETYQMDQGYISVRPTVASAARHCRGGRTALVPLL